jgi:CubicO group peptidase (beta-lactamase class C family)
VLFKLAIACRLAACIAAGCGAASVAAADRQMFNADEQIAESEPDFSAIDAVVASTYENAQYPALAVSIRRGDQLVYQSIQGHANLELQSPASEETVFQIGSLTKSYTAVLIAQLLSEGQLKLDDSVGQHLPNYRGPGRSATIRQLMNHTSGIPNFTEKSGYSLLKRQDVERSDVLALFEMEPLEFQPGTQFSYSNSGTYLLGLVAEAATGRDLASLYEAKVFAPLGLQRTYYTPRSTLVPGRATGYGIAGGSISIEPVLDPELPFAAGVLSASIGDVQRFVDQIHRKNALGDGVREILYRRETLPDGTVMSYALSALVFEQFAGQQKISHTGSIDGFGAIMAYYPETDYSIVVLGNTRQSQPSQVDLEAQIARMVLGMKRPMPSGAPLSAAELGQFVGTYTISRPDGIPQIRIAHHAGGLALQMLGLGIDVTAIPLVHLQDGTFVALNNDAMIVRFSTADGAVHAMQLDINGSAVAYERAD